MPINFPMHKTKIVGTIGPASDSDSVLMAMMSAGMSVARLNFAHGNFAGHREIIRRIRSAAAKAGWKGMILADLPGPKIRVGRLQNEPIELQAGNRVVLTIEAIEGTSERFAVSDPRLPESVCPGDHIFLNDGFIQLRVRSVSATEVNCEVIIGGELLSHKGVNLPGARLSTAPITAADLEWVAFCLKEGITAVGISFVQQADDILQVKEFARERGGSIQVVAKIERAEAVRNIEQILQVADALMIARGDLGVQMPVEEVPAVQKMLIHKANLQGCPVITATQMLVSMTNNIRPTRAEASDVANAILDGTDAIMLSEETAVGRYPVESVAMMGRIATSIERESRNIRALSDLQEYFRNRLGRHRLQTEDVISFNVAQAVEALNARFILAPTKDGSTPRRISRFKPDCWTIAGSVNQATEQFLNLSYGVLPVLLEQQSGGADFRLVEEISAAGRLAAGDTIIVAEDVSADGIDGTDSLRIIQVAKAE